MTQVIGNLLGNATKFTPLTGRIVIKLEVENGCAVVSVSDNGCGIPPERTSRIFEMFSQGEQAARHGAGGLGISLAPVKQLVEMHGGDIVAESMGVGHGSVFTCKLPLHSSDESASNHSDARS